MRAVDPRWNWGIASGVLVAGTFLSTVLATVVVDTLLIRPVAASVNTLLPGWTYGAVAILKVCLVAGIAALCAFVTDQVWRRWFPDLGRAATDVRADFSMGSASPESASGETMRWMAIVSVLLPSVAPLVGAVGVVIAQAVIRLWGDVTLGDVEYMSRIGVVVMGMCLIGGFGAGAVALVRRGAGRPLGVLGFAANAILIALFWYWQFYAAGFDQDRWAPS